jgi:tetratricopeptide (TPR) repeat protein
MAQSSPPTTADDFTDAVTVRSRGRTVQSAIALVIAVPLIVFAVPQLIADIVSARGNDVLTRLQNDETVSAEDLDTLIRATERARAWVDNGRSATDLGLAKILAADRRNAMDAEARGEFEEAIAVLRDGLTKAPGNAYAWARLAYAEARLDGFTPAALSALRLALLTATNEPRLLWPRLSLSLRAWPHMTDTDRSIVANQIRIAWGENPEELARLAVDGQQESVVRGALGRNRADIEKFDKLVNAAKS